MNEEGDHGLITQIELSPSGFWLATGTNEGTCHIWDMIAGSAILSIPAPSSLDEETNAKKKSVHSMAWCLAKRSLLISYLNGLISEWCMTTREHQRSLKLEEPPVLACYTKDGKWIVVQADSANVYDEGMSIHSYQPEEPLTASTMFNGCGSLILGDGKGQLTFLQASDLSLISKQSDLGSPVVQIHTHHQKSDMLLVIFKDRSIRVYRVEKGTELKFHLKFVDVINRSNWATAGFSHDGELAYGAVKEKGKHSICLWELVKGTITKTLEGTREDLVDIRWHPKRPIVVSLSKFGTCYIWKPQYPKKWSALFPGMKEVEENVHYIEREDEFDEVQESRPDQEEKVDESKDVDIHTLLPSVTPDDLLELQFFAK